MIFSLFTPSGEGYTAVILYNFFAFAVQMPLGLLSDRWDRNGALAAAGLLCSLFAFFCTSHLLLCACVLGFGNACYHVGAGVDVLHFSDRKQWMLGVFVSPGAVGLYVGTLLAEHRLLPLPAYGLLLAALSLSVAAGLHLLPPLHRPSGNPPLSLRPTGRAPILAALSLFLVVVLRSYVGVTLYAPWKSGALLPLLSVLSLALGKAAGGLLADRFGDLRTAFVSLSLCAFLFLFAEHALFGLLAVFLFNMTMPQTLFAFSKLFRGASGFAFGALTFALFLGCVPQFLSLPIPFYGKVAFHAAEALLSLFLLLLGLLSCRERKEARS